MGICGWGHIFGEACMTVNHVVKWWFPVCNVPVLCPLLHPAFVSMVTALYGLPLLSGVLVLSPWLAPSPHPGIGHCTSVLTPFQSGFCCNPLPCACWFASGHLPQLLIVLFTSGFLAFQVLFSALCPWDDRSWGWRSKETSLKKQKHSLFLDIWDHSDVGTKDFLCDLIRDPWVWLQWGYSKRTVWKS